MAVTGAEPISAENLAAALGSGVRFASDEDALAYLYGVNEDFSVSSALPGSVIVTGAAGHKCEVSGKTVSLHVSISLYPDLNLQSGMAFLAIPERYWPADAARISGDVTIVYGENWRTAIDFSFEGGQLVADESNDEVSSITVDITYEAANVSGATGGEAVTLEQMLQVLNRI